MTRSTQVPDTIVLPDSPRRFSDGARYRVEIPSVEGPDVFEAVLDEARARSVVIDRVSQGSGVMMLTDAEIGRMVETGSSAGIEVSLFLGPRGAWDIGAQARVTAAVGGAARGSQAVGWCVAEARRACRLGIRSLLVGDIGVLSVLGRLRAEGELPANLCLKTSVVIPAANPPAVRVLADLGANTVNVATDLTVTQLAEIRGAVGVPLDVYVEVPDDQSGAVRFYEVPEIVRVAAPVYIKFGVRNAPNIYPSGLHVAELAQRLGRERVRRAQLCLELLATLAPDLVGERGSGSPRPDLAVPEA